MSTCDSETSSTAPVLRPRPSAAYGIGRRGLFIFLGISLLAVVVRFALDCAGSLFGLLVVDLIHIGFTLLALWGTYKYKPQFLGFYISWLIFWFIWNILVICVFQEVGLLTKESSLIDFGGESHSFWATNGPGCRMLDDDELPAGTAPEGAGLHPQDRVTGCNMDYATIETIMAAIQIVLALIGFIMGMYEIYVFTEELDVLQRPKCESQEVYSISVGASPPGAQGSVKMFEVDYRNRDNFKGRHVFLPRFFYTCFCDGRSRLPDRWPPKDLESRVSGRIGANLWETGEAARETKRERRPEFVDPMSRGRPETSSKRRTRSKSPSTSSTSSTASTKKIISQSPSLGRGHMSRRSIPRSSQRSAKKNYNSNNNSNSRASRNSSETNGSFAGEERSRSRSPSNRSTVDSEGGKPAFWKRLIGLEEVERKPRRKSNSSRSRSPAGSVSSNASGAKSPRSENKSAISTNASRSASQSPNSGQNSTRRSSKSPTRGSHNSKSPTTGRATFQTLPSQASTEPKTAAAPPFPTTTTTTAKTPPSPTKTREKTPSPKRETKPKQPDVKTKQNDDKTLNKDVKSKPSDVKPKQNSGKVKLQPKQNNENKAKQEKNKTGEPKQAAATAAAVEVSFDKEDRTNAAKVGKISYVSSGKISFDPDGPRREPMVPLDPGGLDSTYTGESSAASCNGDDTGSESGNGLRVRFNENPDVHHMSPRKNGTLTNLKKKLRMTSDGVDANKRNSSETKGKRTSANVHADSGLGSENESPQLPRMPRKSSLKKRSRNTSQASDRSSAHSENDIVLDPSGSAKGAANPGFQGDDPLGANPPARFPPSDASSDDLNPALTSTPQTRDPLPDLRSPLSDSDSTLTDVRTGDGPATHHDDAATSGRGKTAPGTDAAASGKTDGVSRDSSSPTDGSPRSPSSSEETPRSGSPDHGYHGDAEGEKRRPVSKPEAKGAFSNDAFVDDDLPTPPSAAASTDSRGGADPSRFSKPLRVETTPLGLDADLGAPLSGATATPAIVIDSAASSPASSVDPGGGGGGGAVVAKSKKGSKKKNSRFVNGGVGVGVGVGGSVDSVASSAASTASSSKRDSGPGTENNSDSVGTIGKAKGTGSRRRKAASSASASSASAPLETESKTLRDLRNKNQFASELFIRQRSNVTLLD